MRCQLVTKIRNNLKDSKQQQNLQRKVHKPIFFKENHKTKRSTLVPSKEQLVLTSRLKKINESELISGPETESILNQMRLRQ